MKKPTISLDEFKRQLVAVAEDLVAAADFDFADPDVREWANVEAPAADFFHFQVSSPAFSQGRGQRLRLSLGWIWWPGKIDPGRGARMVASRITELPGVEEVGEPRLDPQLSLVWQLDVVLRTSQ